MKKTVKILVGHIAELEELEDKIISHMKEGYKVMHVTATDWKVVVLMQK